MLDAETARLTVETLVDGEPVRVEMDVPLGQVRMPELLPALQQAANAFGEAAARKAAREGRPVSCDRGCGACCRQLVPLAPAEARRLAELVASLPDGRRAEVEARFAAARERLSSGGLLARLLAPEGWREGESRALGLAYFDQGVACPFLDEESCTIYHERPIACREYLVSSPPSHCAQPDRFGVDGVTSPVKVWPAVSRTETGAAGERVAWVPLILAPEWARSHPDDGALLPGPVLLREVFGKFARMPEAP